MTRVLHVNKFLHRRGGAEGYMLDLADLQRGAGHEVAFFGMEHPENDVPCAGRAASYVEFEPPPRGTGRRLALAGRMVWSPSSWRGMHEALREFRPDVVHVHNAYHQLSPSVVQAAAAAGVPVVMTLHDYKLVCPTYRFLDRDGRPCTACVDGGPLTAARLACKDGSRAASAAAAIEVSLHRRLGAWSGVRRFLAPSRFLRDQVLAAGVGHGRVHHQPNFTALPPRLVEPDAARRAGASPYVVLAGRLSSEKGADTAVEAVGRLDGVRLEVAGDGPDRAALEELAARVAPDRVRFHGRLAPSALRPLLAGARAALVPSRWHENQPLSVLEAHALAVPVVATDLGGLPELVDSSCGWVVPPDDPGALAAAVADVLGRPEEGRRRGAEGRRRAEENHDPQEHLRAIQRHYEEAGAP